MDVGMLMNGILLNMKGLRVNMVRGLLVMLSTFPLKFHYFMGDILSWIAAKVIRYRADVVWVNISMICVQHSASRVTALILGYNFILHLRQNFDLQS